MPPGARKYAPFQSCQRKSKPAPCRTFVPFVTSSNHMISPSARDRTSRRRTWSMRPRRAESRIFLTMSRSGFQTYCQATARSNPCHTPAAGLLWLNCPADALETHVESLAFHLPAVDLRAFGFSVIEFVKPKRIIIKTANESNAITTAAMINEPRSAMKHCKASIFSGL